MKKARFLKKWWVPGAVVVFAALVFLVLASGYRVGPGLSIVRVGALILGELPEGASVYVDGSFIRQSSGGTARVTLLPGNHTVIVSADERLPWSELVTIVSDQETHETPLLMPNRTSASIIMGERAITALKLVNAAKLPTAAAPLSRENGCALVSVSANRIVADASTTPACVPPPYLCTDGTCGTTVVFSPIEPINSVLPFPGREDMLIVSVGQSLFVLELDPREPGFFAPIIPESYDKGPVRAAITPEGTIVATIGTQTFEIEL